MHAQVFQSVRADEAIRRRHLRVSHTTSLRSSSASRQKAEEAAGGA